MKCRTCHKRVESMRTTDTGVTFICENCGRDLSPKDIIAAEPDRKSSARQPVEAALAR